MLAMVVAWQGEDPPPDKAAWIDVLREALAEEDGSYWVRFHREPEGWRFDLECRRADEPRFQGAGESVALHVYTLLVESGKPLDPGWRPFAPSPPAAIVRTPAPVAAAAPPVAKAATLGGAPPTAAAGNLPSKRRRGRRRRNDSVRATVAAPVVKQEPSSEPQPPPDLRPPGWRGLRRAIVYLPAVLLVAFAWWVSRDRLQSPPASPPAPSPSATVSQEALAADERLKEPEPVVAQQERAQMSSRRRPAAPAAIGAAQPASTRPPTQPVEERADEILAPTPAPAPTPTPLAAPAAAEPAPTDVPLPTDLSVSTDAAVSTAPEPAAAPEPPPTPSPVQGGAIVDLNDPDLTRPVLVAQTRPRYPPLALARRLSGTVWVNALVDETGAVVEVSLVRASPRGLGFEDAATRYARTRVYRPATKQGVPVRVWVPLVIEFRLPGR